MDWFLYYRDLRHERVKREDLSLNSDGRFLVSISTRISSPTMEKNVLNMPSYGCMVEHFVLVFILICFTAFGNLDFLDLPCVALILNVYKKNYHLRIFGKINGRNFFAEFIFAIHDPTQRNLFWKKKSFPYKKRWFFRKTYKKWTWFAKIYSAKNNFLGVQNGYSKLRKFLPQTICSLKVLSVYILP